MAKYKDVALSAAKAIKTQNEPVIPKLTAAQIQNRRYSIYIKRLKLSDETAKSTAETEKAADSVKELLTRFGAVTNVSINAQKHTAIVRFEQISSAEAAYKESRDTRASILGESHPDSQVVYVIPEKSLEDLKVLEAAKRNESYDPCTDESLTLEEATTFIDEKNQEI